MTTEMLASPTSDRRLRWLADSYEQAQRIRIETGERIRAVLQGRDETWSAEEGWEMPEGMEAEDLLVDIAAGKSLGPVAILGRTYHRHHHEERELYAEMHAVLLSHPCWPWLDKVRGIGPTLACKLLARLDPVKAPHASSFWAFCGLATVPGERYRCETCGLVRAWPVGYNVTGKHQALGQSGKCPGTLELVAGPEDGVRAAQPKAQRGQKRSYDAYAKKIMYLVAGQFLKAGGPYEEHYRRARARLETERPGWADGRKHLTAMRIVEKLFLAHLWQIWRAELGLPVDEPYAAAELGHTHVIDPWDMTGK